MQNKNLRPQYRLFQDCHPFDARQFNRMQQILPERRVKKGRGQKPREARPHWLSGKGTIKPMMLAGTGAGGSSENPFPKKRTRSLPAGPRPYSLEISLRNRLCSPSYATHSEHRRCPPAFPAGGPFFINIIFVFISLFKQLHCA